MDELKKIHLFLTLFPVIMIVLVIFIVLLVTDSAGGDSSIVMINGDFRPPFSPEVEYTITSNFGTRVDPINGSESFHSGIDVTAPEGTDIVASANGVVIETGYQENGLGNYVYMEHNVNGIIFYTAYGHMLDDSIVVSEGQIVYQYEKLGTIGSSGRSTGRHCHFMIMTPKLKFDKENLLDPLPIFEKDMKEKEEKNN